MAGLSLSDKPQKTEPMKKWTTSDIKQELREMQGVGRTVVLLNGWRESIKYVMSLTNLGRITHGNYITTNQ